MKFAVLALDFDGTIAAPCGVHPDVRAAIGELRSRGTAVILATGRILSDLRKSCLLELSSVLRAAHPQALRQHTMDFFVS